MLIDSLSIYAKNVTDNLLWEVDTLGFVPNANMSWGMNRSQPPYLAMMVEDVYHHDKDKEWLAIAYKTLKKEYHFWTDTSKNAIENHTTQIPGLQRFYFHSSVEELEKIYASCYERQLVDLHPDSIGHEEKLRIAGYFAAEAATGMDFTPRFENRCPEFVAVELNANLYKYEVLFDYFVKELGLKNEPNWKKKANTRKKLMRKYCWNEARGMFMDYDFVNNRFSKVAAITCMSPLVMGVASKQQAAKTRMNLPLFEYEYGVTICEKTETAIDYQWDYPAGWPPIYQLTANALSNYGYKTDALRVCEKYMDIVAKNFIAPNPTTYIKKGKTITRKPGFIYEKYNVVTGGINDNEYPARQFIGWSAGTFIWCLDYYNKSK
jgi:alpha,alpha-trehalase